MPLFVELSVICAWRVCVCSQFTSTANAKPNHKICRSKVRAVRIYSRLWCVNSPVVTLNNKKRQPTPRLCFWFFFVFTLPLRLPIFQPGSGQKKLCMLTEWSPQKPKLDYSPGRLRTFSLSRSTINTKKVHRRRRNHGNFVSVRERNLPFWCGSQTNNGTK